MLTHEEMIGLQAEKHGLIGTDEFASKQEYVLHLIHTPAYVSASSLTENKKVLDLGCNTGYGTEILFKSSNNIIGVDVSERAILSAKNKYSHLGINFQLIDGVQLPFNDNEFDVIVSFQVIEHIVDYEKYMNELKRVLKPQGIVIFTTPNALLRLDPGMKPWNKFHVREFNHSELKSLLKTFFPQVSILGLFAREPLYSIELNRVKQARNYAREKQEQIAHSSSISLRTRVKRIIPKFILSAVRGIQRFPRNVFKPKNSKSKVDVKLVKFINKYSVQDLFYRIDNLESALDLLAICANEEEGFKEYQLKLTSKIS